MEYEMTYLKETIPTDEVVKDNIDILVINSYGNTKKIRHVFLLIENCCL